MLVFCQKCCFTSRGLGTGHLIYILFIVEGHSPAHQGEKGNLPQHLQDLFKTRRPGQEFCCLYFLEKSSRNCQCPCFLYVFTSKGEISSLILERSFLPLNSGPISYSVISYFTGTLGSLTRVGHSRLETFLVKSGLKCHCTFAFINHLYMIIITLLAVTQHWALVIYVQQITAVGEKSGFFPLLPDNWGFA